MRIGMKTNIVSSVILGILAIFAGTLFVAEPPEAHSLGNLSGWLWGGSQDDSGVHSGLGWISVSDVNLGGAVPYGLDIPSGDGDLSGAVYSENMGYIVFDNSAGLLAGCPDGNCRAYRKGNALKGWARFSDIAQEAAVGNAGGNLGWIHLSGSAQNSAPYGVSVNTDGTLAGYAWSDEFGAISFEGAKLLPSLRLCVNDFEHSSLSLSYPGTEGLKAYYDSGSGCSGNDVTASTTFSKVSGSDVVTLSSPNPPGTSPFIITINNPDTGPGRQSASETISAAYSGQSKDLELFVVETCSYDCSAQEDDYCSGEKFSVTDSCGSVRDDVCEGIRNCNFNWREVAPGE